MPNYTQHNNLILPFEGENYDIKVANTNNIAIDAVLNGKVNKVNGKDLSTNDFTNEYKIKIDKLSNMFSVKGTVATIQDLENILNPKENDAYLVSSENEVYGYTVEQGWISLGSIFNITVIENNIVQRVNENVNKKLEVHTATKTIPCKATADGVEQDTTITNGYEVTIPDGLQYQVGNNSLEVRLNGIVLIKATDTKDGHYKEVGEAGALSNKITFYRTEADGNWVLYEDITMTFVIRGVAQNGTE